LKIKSQKKSHIHSYINSRRSGVVRRYDLMSSSLKIFPLLLIIFLLFLSCEKQSPISEEKFIKVYVDLLILQDTTGTNSSAFDSLKTLVFKNHNISAEEYEATINYYNSEPKRWEGFFDKAIAYAEKLKNEAK
jgi:hypothetical protein